MERNRKTGIMGGTFNPVHNGHLQLAAEAYRTLGLDEVLFMPSGNSYMKDNVLAAEPRIAMLERAISPYPYFKLSRLEVERGGDTYTCETLQELTEADLRTRYYFIMGADALFQIGLWHRPEVIYELAVLVCAVRGDYDRTALEERRRELMAAGAEVILLDMPPVDISSSDIRARIRGGQSIRGLVPDAVADYITQERIYVQGDS